MSEIRCTNCGKMMSDGATFCRHCGSRIEYVKNANYERNNQVQAKADSSRRNKIILIVGGCIIGVLVVVLIMVIINSTSKNRTSSTESDSGYSTVSSNTSSDNSTAGNSTVNGAINSTALQNAGDFILADSDKRFISREELMKLTQEQVRMACNELYARHGRKFLDANIQAYFNSKSWYIGTIEPEAFDEAVFNEYEQKNKDIIVMYETEMHYR